MKKKLIENLKIKPARKYGCWTTVQEIENILVLNIFSDKILQARHCINIETKEYATLKNNKWTQTSIETAYGLDAYYTYYYGTKKKEKMSEENKKLIQSKLLQADGQSSIIRLIGDIEREYRMIIKNNREGNRIDRVNKLMGEMPAIPLGLKEWINQKELGGEDYCIINRETGRLSCSSCGASFDEKDILTDEKQIKNGSRIICPKCKKEIVMLRLKKSIKIKTHFCMICPIDEDISAVRHFTAYINCFPGEKKKTAIEENIRIILNKGERNKRPCDIYYKQYKIPVYIREGGYNNDYFDNKSNPCNRKTHQGYLYDAGIIDALKNTRYEKWSRLFKELADTKYKLNYNCMMRSDNDAYIAVMEMLYRGRFYKLLENESKSICLWDGLYQGNMNLDGSSLEEVFGINDKQKINRIREKDGNVLMLNWMRYADQYNKKISDKVLHWLLINNISLYILKSVLERFSAEQAMNYFERQTKESYKGKNVKDVIEQYKDYIRMCEKLYKDINDEMIYRPRELKRRHDECVMEIEMQDAQLKAEEYSKRFSKAEAVLSDIKNKFDFAGEKFFIRTPEKIIDIISEGKYLHHCVGATDRYFDRIEQNETYICFLRKTEEPETPFYTIEVEPGGTIRQHRGMYDEEPELEFVKPFLKEWQKEIRKRMSKKEHELAAASKEKREANIDELRRNNNTRVLKGLMEDFMEAI